MRIFDKIKNMFNKPDGDILTVTYEFSWTERHIYERIIRAIEADSPSAWHFKAKEEFRDKYIIEKFRKLIEDIPPIEEN